MQSHWSDADAQAAIDRYVDEAGNVNEDLALRVYTSRLIGQEPTLVLHGGGNTSAKTRLRDDLGQLVDVLCVKGSGWDLGTIEPAGLPAVRMDTLRALRAREALGDEAMVNAQRIRLLDASAPNPSVETLLHAFLPHRFIDHSHADAILALADQPDAEAICREVFGQTLAVVPYVMPGFDLAKLAAQTYEANPAVEGLVLLRHGLFTFGDTARESYERHVRAVDAAERYAANARATAKVPRAPVAEDAAVDYARLAPVLRGLLGQGTRRYVLERRGGDAVDAFLARRDLASVSGRGPATPDHVIRTKPVPLVLEPRASMDDAALAAHIAERLDAYRTAYEAYVARASSAKGRDVKRLDPDPRIVLVPGVGLIAAGETQKAARVAADIYEHTIDVIESAEAVGRYEPLEANDLFDMEYWSLEQAKLGKAKPRPLAGRVVFITGAASGIGAATARRFVAQGACVYLTDRDAPGVEARGRELGAPHEALDVTDEAAVRASVRRCVETFGGLDGVISNAGVAPQGAMHEVSSEALRRSFEVNLFAHQTLAAAATAVLRAQGTGGFLLFNASKAAFNPGADFGPYAVPKAAVVALMKQYALENGDAGIRANAINADRVRTGLMSEAFVAARARARGLDADAYFRANLLRREVQAEDVADGFVALALAECTTGCVLTVDGGNIAASPR